MKVFNNIYFNIKVIMMFFGFTVCFFTPGRISAEELEDLLGGFSETVEESRAEKENSDLEAGTSSLSQDNSAENLFIFKGALKQLLHYNFAHSLPENNEVDWRGVSSIKTELQLDLKIKPGDTMMLYSSAKLFYDTLYLVKDESNYTDEIIDNYKKDIELKELYLAKSITDNFDLKLGRQIVVWGKSDVFRVADVINPLEIVVPGLTDLEDVRRALTISKLDYYFGKWNISTMAIHEHRYNKLPEYGSDFYPSENRAPNERKPDYKLKNAEYAFALNGTFSGWDISLYWSNLYNDATHLVNENGELFQEHARLNMFGAAYNQVFGSFLLKAEVANSYGLKFYNDKEKKYYRTDLLLGLNYSGLSNSEISIEVIENYLHSFNEKIKNSPDSQKKYSYGVAIRARKLFFNDTLELAFLGVLYDYKAEGGSYQRYTVVYNLMDALALKAGLITYQSGDRVLFKNSGDNDRVFSELKYSF